MLDDDLDFQVVSEDASNDEDYDKELDELSIKSRTEGLCTTDPLRHFAQFNGYQDLALAVGKANDVISSTLPPKTVSGATFFTHCMY